MNNVYNHPSLLISLAIFTGLAFSAILYIVESKKENITQYQPYNIILYFLWTLGVLTIIYIFYLQYIGKGLQVTALSPIGILLASFIASASVIKSIIHNDQHKSDEKEKEKSKFHMIEADNGLDNIFNLLKDKNNNSVIWESASEIIHQILELEQEINNKSHLTSYILHKKIIQIKLKKVLSAREDFLSLPVSFFYGIKNWDEEGMTAKKAYEEALIGGLYFSSNKMFDINHRPLFTNIPPESVKTVYEFLTNKDLTSAIKSHIQSGLTAHSNNIAEGAIMYYNHLPYAQKYPKVFKRKEVLSEPLKFLYSRNGEVTEKMIEEGIPTCNKQ